MRQGPLTAIACRPSRLPFNRCTLQPGMFRSESAVAAWSASIALLQRLCGSGCTFRLLPVSKSSRNPACRKLTTTASSVKHTRQSVNYRFTLRCVPDSSRHARGANRTTLMAPVVGERGQVVAVEVDAALASKARANLAAVPCVDVPLGDATRLAGVEELDVEGILAFAERMLPRAADLWSMRHSTTATACSSCSSPRALRTTEIDSIEPL